MDGVVALGDCLCVAGFVIVGRPKPCAMSDGGYFPWRRQCHDNHRGPAVTYSQIGRQLPKPPSNKQWIQDTTSKEWRLEERQDEDIVATAELVGELDDTHFHVIKATDTLEGICLQYKVTATQLRQANHGFQGNLSAAPNPLRIPKNGVAVSESCLAPEDSPICAVETLHSTPQQKLSQLLRSCPKLAEPEAKSYLELNDWDLNESFLNAREDGF